MPDVSVVLDGCQMALADDTLRAIVMTDVFHHLPDPRRFFKEAARCVSPWGAVVMIEPWVTPWSRMVYRKLHHEPFRPDVQEWAFPGTGPLSGANSALPWIIFQRDRAQFESEFPQWQIKMIKLGMPFRYLLSGGVSMQSLMPAWTSGFWQSLEKRLQPWMNNWDLFALIILDRVHPFQ